MSHKIPQIRVYPPSGRGRGRGQAQTSTRFPWLAKTDKLPHHTKVIHQPLRFFGSTHCTSTGKYRGKGDHMRLVNWENTFNMRANNLRNFQCANYKTNYRAQSVAMQRAKLSFISDTAESLDVLRQNLQKSINKEIDQILQKYLEKFFKLAITNIKINKGEHAVAEHHVQTVCRQILEEAKKMYKTDTSRTHSPLTDYLEIEPKPVPEPKPRASPKNASRKRKEKDSDTDSEASTVAKPRKKKRKALAALLVPEKPTGRSTPLKLKPEPLKRAGPKWDPSRLTAETEFIMGAKANKALGLGATRGRLYIKHQDIFKYPGDQDDKQWLYDHNLMPSIGGKAYMLLLEDIRELAESEEYKYNLSLLPDEIVGFTVSETILEKMKVVMQQMRTDIPQRKRCRGAVGNADVSKVEDAVSDGKCSGTATPTDELDLLSTDIPSTDRSPFSLSTPFDDISPLRADVSPAPSDISTSLEPPLTASFDITSTP